MFSGLRNKLNNIIEFGKKAVSEQDGLPSTSRIIAFLIAVTIIICVLYVTFHTGTLPDLTSAALLLGAGTGGYAANKISGMLGKGD